MIRSLVHCLLVLLCAAHVIEVQAADTVSLAGTWRCQLDPGDAGTTGNWFNKALEDKIELPGSTDQAKLGLPNSEKPNLDGLYRLHPYAGVAWYQRDVEIPADWAGKRVRLFIERAHWETHAWLDDKPLGGQDSMISPHVYELGKDVPPGKHRLTVSVDNRLKYDLGRFVSIHYEGTQTSWNGMIGRIELEATDPVSIEDLQVYPEVDRKLARVKARVSHGVAQPCRGQLLMVVGDHQTGLQVTSTTTEIGWSGTAVEVDVELSMGPDVKLWDEFSPSLYDLVTTLTVPRDGTTMTAGRSITFGMRELGIRGTQFALNGRPIFLRGTLECGIFPLTGYPPTSVPEWQRIYRIMKSYGLNHIRFHSWCPPDAAFAAADIEGIYVQAEGPEANIVVGNSPGLDVFMENELLRIVRTYGNHPSFCLMTLGNEHKGVNRRLDRWVDMLVREDPRRYYSSASAGELTLNRQFTVGYPRGVRGPATDGDFREELAKHDRPLVGHEIGQWTFFPDFQEIGRYTGVLAAKNFELIRDDLAAKHQLDLAPRYFHSTGNHAVLLYKEEIEVLLRTPGHAGFALLDLHDYPGQGTALVGPLDPFWESKGFVSPERHRRYCGPTVPLLRLKKRTFTTTETLSADVDVAHFGPKDIGDVSPTWSIRDETGSGVASGLLPKANLRTGRLSSLGSFRASLETATAPCKLTVTVALLGTDFSNDWDIWVYPAGPVPAAPADVVVTREWNADTVKTLQAGKRVVLFTNRATHTKSLRGKFLPVFWSPVWFPRQKPNTMGIRCDPGHPALRGFPTEGHSNWQWWELVNSSRSLILDDAPADFRPVVQVIDNFARNHRLGILFEARVGSGSLLTCSIPLPAMADSCPPARQLLESLYDYAASPDFRPTKSLDVTFLDAMLKLGPQDIMQNAGARIVRASSQSSGCEATNILDGDPGSIWHTAWHDPVAPLPHEVVISFERPVTFLGLRVLPRQDKDNARIKGYEVVLSDDSSTWRKVGAGSLEDSDEEQQIRFPTAESAQYIKLTALSAHGKQPYVAIAELSVIESK